MRISFRASLLSTIMIMIGGFAMAVLVSLWVISTNAAQDTASQLFHSISKSMNEKVERLVNQATGSAEIGVEILPQSAITSDVWFETKFAPMVTILKSYSEIYSLYFGYEDGSFFQVIAARGEEDLLKLHNTGPETAWIVRRIHLNEAGTRVQEWYYYDEELKEVGRNFTENPLYDPRIRPWYLGGIVESSSFISDVYLFNSSGKPGITAAKRLPQGQGVFGSDLTLDLMNEFVNEQEISENAILAIFNANQEVVAISDKAGEVKQLALISEIPNDFIQNVFATTQNQEGFFVTDAEHSKIFSSRSEVNFYGNIFSILIVAPDYDFLSAFEKMQHQILLYTLIVLVLFIPMAFLFSSHFTKRVNNLAHNAQKIKHLEFSYDVTKPSRIEEFYALECSFVDMNDSLDEKNRALHLSQAKLNRLVELGVAMAAERDLENLMEMFLDGAKDIANAEGATLYVIEDDYLVARIFKNDRLGDLRDENQDLLNLPLFDEDGTANYSSFASHCAHKAQSTNITDAYSSFDFDMSRTQLFDMKYAVTTQSILNVPLKPRGRHVLGVLQLVNARDAQSGQVIDFSSEIQRFCEALSAQAATIMQNVNFFDDQENLMDAMIQILAGAIDAKSPYTGGHCLRVPELAIMLAQKACDEKDGPLGQFMFKTEEEWREFTIGAWLHDCGKVVTPEFVVDKATKLETIYNRIHEIRTRFEVLLRDAEINCLKKTQREPHRKEEFEQHYQEIKQELRDEFAFVAKSNVATEYMDDADIERLEKISSRTWVRQLDMTLGLAHLEEEQYQSVRPAPCVEKLLIDGEHHLIKRDTIGMACYDAQGFKMDIPENQYNRGELYNLSVRKGTLSTEERFKINEHIMQTILMLETLPFPSHLKRVPEYAGTHHETMSGTGYPRKLSAKDLSVPARIMAIADIFEALTASDRPYKKAKTLSEAIAILYTFKLSHHIDPVLFDLFLTSGVYKDYAERFLSPDQIDEVEIDQYLSDIDSDESIIAS